MYHYAGNNPIRYIDPDGRSPSLSDLQKFAREIKKSGEVDGNNLFLENPGDGCFARASIIAKGLRERGYTVNYAYANNPRIPGGEERFNYHIAACVEIKGEVYVVDPLYNLEGPNSGLSKFDDWIKFQNTIEGEKNDKKNRIISGYNKDGTVKENYKLSSLYHAFNKNRKLSIAEYAVRLLEYYKKKKSLEYDGGDIK